MAGVAFELCMLGNGVREVLESLVGCSNGDRLRSFGCSDRDRRLWRALNATRREYCERCAHKDRFEEIFHL